MHSQIQLAVDIGGTFTDVVLDLPERRFTRKVLTTPQSPEQGLMDGARLVLNEAGLRFSDLDVFVHGTTLATNAILERRGARTALIATDGFRDVLEIGTESRFNQYDLQIQLPRPLIPRELRFGVRERMTADGEPLLPLDEPQVEALATQLRDLAVESVAIAFLHAYANPLHERLAANILAQALPGVSITLASEVCPEIKEYERTSTAAANAYVQPQLDRYLGRMVEALKEERFGGSLFLVSSSGALTSVDTARRFPVRLVESGPAGGAIFAASLARELDERNVISFDMGGTTAKVCLIKDYTPLKGRTFEVDRTQRFAKGSGLPIRIPVTEMVEIGAGGGSIAAVDVLGNVVVGPESASSNPGPACFGLGGNKPTVTDADLMLGLLDPETFAGGTVQLSPSAAKTAFETNIGNRTSMSATEAAFAAYEVVCENMAAAARAHAVELGETLTNFTMIAFGGAAPLHAARVAEKLGVRKLVIPPNAGLGSAIGFLSAPVAYEIIRTTHMPLDRFDAAKANALLAMMSEEAQALVRPALGDVEPVETRAAYIRYVGQSNEIEVRLPLRALTDSDVAQMRSGFEAAYAKQFTRVIPGSPLELLNWAVLVSSPSRAGDSGVLKPSMSVSVTDGAPARKVFEPRLQQWTEASIRTRSQLVQGQTLVGPSLVIEKDTTSFITASFTARLHTSGSLVLESNTVA